MGKEISNKKLLSPKAGTATSSPLKGSSKCKETYPKKNCQEIDKISFTILIL